VTGVEGSIDDAFGWQKDEMARPRRHKRQLTVLEITLSGGFWGAVIASLLFFLEIPAIDDFVEYTGVTLLPWSIGWGVVGAAVFFAVAKRRLRGKTPKETKDDLRANDHPESTITWRANTKRLALLILVLLVSSFVSMEMGFPLHVGEKALVPQIGSIELMFAPGGGFADTFSEMAEDLDQTLGSTGSLSKAPIITRKAELGVTDALLNIWSIISMGFMLAFVTPILAAIELVTSLFALELLPALGWLVVACVAPVVFILLPAPFLTAVLYHESSILYLLLVAAMALLFWSPLLYLAYRLFLAFLGWAFDGGGGASASGGSGRPVKSIERETLSGDKYWEHLDEGDNLVGESYERETVFGNKYVERLDSSGNYVGKSEEMETLFGGRTYTQHSDGGRTEQVETLFGDKYAEQVDSEGNLVRRSRKVDPLFGEKHIEHEYDDDS